MKFSCPACQQHLEAEAAMAGREIQCPACGGDLAVPSEQISPVDSPARKSRRWLFPILLCLVMGGIAGGFFYSRKDRGKAPLQSARAIKKKKPANPQLSYVKDVQPLLTEYCYNCHGNGKKKADLALDQFQTEQDIQADRKTWEKVMLNLRSGEMPPPDKPKPTLQQRDTLVAWIEGTIFKTDCDNPDPGRVTLRRLNRVEYNNTIRDLVGVDFQPADDFPADDSGHGFDNIGDVLSLSPILLEKYLHAAEKIMDQALMVGPPRPPLLRFEAQALEGGGLLDKTERMLASNGDVSKKHQFSRDGKYRMRVKAYGQPAGSELPKLSFQLDDKEFKAVAVDAIEASPKVYEAEVSISAGPHKIGAAFVNDYYDQKHPNKALRGDRNLVIGTIEIEGPLGQAGEYPPSHHRILGTRKPGEDKLDAAREIIGRFGRGAFRRPLSAQEIDRLMAFVGLAEKNKEPFERGVQLALQAILVSPHFLFRGELQPEPNNPAVVHDINEHALASRLSFFIWSSMPDATLSLLADQGQLRKNLDREVKRMLKDPKSRALVDNFAGQWLQLRNLKLVAPDKEQFPEWDDSLRLAMEKETELFFETIMREDRSVLEFIDADYTFVNQRLARHYQMTGVNGDDFQKVSLKGTQRRGLLTHASVLTITSNPTRTSPVKRGKWVLENILGTPPPPPPPEVPELSEDKEKILSGTLRQRMVQHREDPNCASCHARMDPIGFGLENFDGIGAWRTLDGRFPVETAGELVTGEKFKTAGDLSAILSKAKREEFVRCLAERMLTYALGRGTEYYDKCAVEEITGRLEESGYRFSSLIIEVARSVPFQKRRGEGDRLMTVSHPAGTEGSVAASSAAPAPRQ